MELKPGLSKFVTYYARAYYQSYHSGIETLVLKDKAGNTVATNRTIVELKLLKVPDNTEPQLTTNRTIVELKLDMVRLYTV